MWKCLSSPQRVTSTGPVDERTEFGIRNSEFGRPPWAAREFPNSELRTPDSPRGASLWLGSCAVALLLTGCLSFGPEEAASFSRAEGAAKGVGRVLFLAKSQAQTSGTQTRVTVVPSTRTVSYAYRAADDFFHPMERHRLQLPEAITIEGIAGMKRQPDGSYQATFEPSGLREEVRVAVTDSAGARRIVVLSPGAFEARYFEPGELP